MFRRRILANRLQQLVARFPVVVVSGARQVGKSTLINRLFPDSLGWTRVLLDPIADVGGARGDPNLFLDAHPPPLVLDEIQFAPELVPAIKRRLDRATASGSGALPMPRQYVLTGSQQWAVLRTASESLAGRAVFLDLEGFALAELAAEPLVETDVDPDSSGLAIEAHWLKRYLADPSAFVRAPMARPARPRSLHDQLWRGFLPAANAMRLDDVPTFWQAYLRTYVERDVRLLGEVDDWQQFGRFIQLLAALTAQEINFSQLGREIGINPKTAQRWLALLRATFQWFELPAFHGNAIKRISGRPKGHVADTGLACAMQQISSPAALAGHPSLGALFESMMVAEVRKISATLPTPPAMYHWRTHAGAEVDILLERDGTLFPIEVKLTSHPTRGMSSGISALRETYPNKRIAPGLVISAGEMFGQLAEHAWSIPFDAP